MTEIYLIRHAQAEGNRFRIMQGQWDGGVTELGRRQIALLEERQQARKDKNYARADQIREQLKALGYAIEDSRQGAKLKKL